ncbi:MBOAT-domain-containing protein [Panus rudis PR-1116 ss-1]|nr:MBOAT-domain-containing protein [Panus rudis PR-1116 ss-1]
MAAPNGDTGHNVMLHNTVQNIIDDARTTPAATRTASGGYATKEGTVYVSKPFRSRTNKKLRAMISFVPRKSTFENESSKANEFRGFFTLFWISMFLVSVNTYIRGIEETGSPLEFAFASMFSEDAITLALSDAVLVGSTFICVPFAKAIQKGWIRYYWVGVILQHLWQTTVLAAAVTWTFNRHWPWVQSGFLTLHTLVLMMKMHSYVSTNGYLSWVHQQVEAAKQQLYELTDEPTIGGWSKALEDAEANRRKLVTRSESSESVSISGGEENTPGSGTPSVPEGTATSYVDVKTANQLRHRLNQATKENAINEKDKVASSQASFTTQSSVSAKPDTTGNNILEPSSVNKPTSHPLINHPDPRVSGLAQEISEMEQELVSAGPEYVRWPENLTWKNFAVYMLIPTLVYELEYPRTDRIRPLYVFEKTVATFGTFALLYTVTESFIIPLTPSPDQSFLKSLLDLSIPFMVAYLLLFYIIFECICNGFAELSYFADRNFYDDWWNSTSWDEFSRKWNKPVHTFLLRHVYASTMSSYHLSRQSAMFLTFLLSALAHELVMAVVTKKIRMYLFVMQLAQIPLIAVGRLPAVKRNKTLGNVVFWIGLYAGFPLLCVAYVAH